VILGVDGPQSESRFTTARCLTERDTEMGAEREKIMIDGKAVLGFLGNDVIETFGEPSMQFSSAASARPGKLGGISFVTKKALADDANIVIESLSTVIISCELGESPLDGVENKFLIVVANPRLSFAKTASFFFKTGENGGRHSSATVHPSAAIGRNVTLGQNCVIGKDVVIGDNVVVGAGCVVAEKVSIGDNSRIGPNCVIGERGFGYERDQNKSPVHVPHFGGVIIGRNVSIGANTCIDRGTLDDTIIGDNVKIDNQVQIAHNCIVEDSVFIIAGVALGGGVRVRKGAWISPNSTILQHLEVGEGAFVGIGAVVLSDVPPGHTVFGNPARILDSKKS